MKIELEFFGPIPTVKDSYRAVVRKRKTPKPGKPDQIAQVVKDRKLNAKLDYLIEQIPREFWDLGLIHPNITMQRYAPAEYLETDSGKSMSDRDGAFSTALDLFVRIGLLRGSDADPVNNGRWIIEPTKISAQMRFQFILESSE